MKGCLESKAKGLHWVWPTGMIFLGAIAFPLFSNAGCNLGQNNTGVHSNDPTFVFPDNTPAQQLQTAQRSLNREDQGNSAVPSLSEKETALLADFSTKIKDQPSTEAIGTIMEIWRTDHSVDFKRTMLLHGMARTHNSGEVQMMQVMYSALDNLDLQKEKISVLARGNGLEKQAAAKLLLVLNQNPQTRIAE